MCKYQDYSRITVIVYRLGEGFWDIYLPFDYISACAFVLSRFSSVRLFAILQTVAHQTPLSMGCPRQEYWTGLSCSPPQDLLDPEIKPNLSCLLHQQADSLPLAPPGKPHISVHSDAKSAAFICTGRVTVFTIAMEVIILSSK